MRRYESESPGTNKIRGILKQRLAYLHLATALVPELFKQEDVRATLNELAAFIDTATSRDLRLRAEELLRWLEPATAMVNRHLRPLKPWENIAAEYWQLNSKRQLSFQRGVRYEWLARRFDLTAALGLPADLPYHAQVGLASHAGTAAIEEEFLLRDSFYMLVKVRQQFDWLQRYVAMRKAGPVKEFGRISATLAHNVAGFARLAVKSFYSFLECFVNSVGEDFIARVGGLASPEEECLRGKKKGAYLRLDEKIERFPGIIRSDKRRSYCPIPRKSKNRLCRYVGSLKSAMLRCITRSRKKRSGVVPKSGRTWPSSRRRHAWPAPANSGLLATRTVLCPNTSWGSTR
jgi:hypothetical protein